MGNSDCFPRGKPAATESHYPTYCACRVFYCLDNPPNSNTDYRICNVRTVDMWIHPGRGRERAQMFYLGVAKLTVLSDLNCQCVDVAVARLTVLSCELRV